MNITTTNQRLLEKSIEYFGVNDLITIMFSQRRDREILEEQSRVEKDEG